MAKEKNLEDKFIAVKCKRMAQLGYAVSAVLFVPAIQMAFGGLWSAVGVIVSCQLVVFLFARFIEEKGIYNVGSLIVSLILSSLVFLRCLQGGGIDASSSIWFLSVIGSAFVFLQRKHLPVFVAYTSILCAAAYGVTMGAIESPVTVLEEPSFLWLFDYFCNFAALGYLFTTNNSILSEQMKIISEQENALLLNSRLSSMGEMAASIAHEINNPLAVIWGNTDLIKKDLKDPEVERTAIVSRTETITRTIEKIKLIVESMQKLSNGRVDDDAVPVSINNIYREVQNLITNKLKISGVQPDFSVQSEDTFVYGNFTLIGQILLNLISNSLQAIEDLPEKWIKVECDREDKKVFIRVTDSGHGVSKEIAGKIFDPLFTTKDVGKGTGLGLSISKTAAKRMGGQLAINYENPNTQFIVTLRAAKEAIKSRVA